MRYTLLIAAAAVLASTSVGLARTAHHPLRHVPAGYAATPTVPTSRSWLELEHDLDPCHCDGGAP